MNEELKSIDILIPIYNEEKNIIPLIEHIRSILIKNFLKINIIFIDDGSTDKTEEKINDIVFNDKTLDIKYIRLSKNFGKDKALKCGIDHSTSEICAMIDADFQHPVEKIVEAIEKIDEGYNIVHILKSEHNFGGKFRKMGSLLFNRLVNFLSDTEIDLTDFKVMDKKAINKIQNFNETFYFSAGVIDLVGLKSTRIEYEPAERKYGKSKFSSISLAKLAIHSIMAVSVKPLRISIYAGILISSLSLIYGMYILFEKIFLGQTIPGFATLAIAIFFTSGIQLLFLGIIGEYLGKTFIEVKKRPQYLVDYIKEF